MAAHTLVNQVIPFGALDGAAYIALSTYRKSGAAVPTPVWFAEDAGNVYVMTGSHTGKLKRLHNNLHVTVARCSVFGKVDGPTIEGRATILTEAAAIAQAESALGRKYGLLRVIYKAAILPIECAFQRVSTAQTYLLIESA